MAHWVITVMTKKEYLITLTSWKQGRFYYAAQTAYEVSLIGSLINIGVLPWQDWHVEEIL
jgi:hypothetical protein